MFKKFIVAFLSLVFVGLQLYGEEKSLLHQKIKIPYNLNRVTQQVTPHPVKQGEKIIVKERIYKALFEEDKVILKRRHRVLRFQERNPSNQPSQMGEWTDNISEMKKRNNQNGTRDGEFLIDTSIVYDGALGDQVYPSIAFDGTNYLIVWEDYRSDFYHPDIYGARVDTSGKVLDTTGIPISTTANWKYSPSVAFDGTNYLVVWESGPSGSDSVDIYGARVDTSGTVLDTSGIPISTESYSQYTPYIAFDGTNYLVVWKDLRNGSGYDIYGTRVSTSGTVLDPSGIPISTAPHNQEYLSISFDGVNYLVVWTDLRNGSDYDIYGARVSISGTVLDTSGIPISTAASHQGDPSITYDGINYLIVWTDLRNGSEGDIYGARMNTSGIVLDTSGIPISTAAYFQESSSVAYDGTNYFVVWDDHRNGPYSVDIYGARVSPSGTVLDPTGILILTAAKRQYYPSIAFDGINYLVVWEDYRSGSYPADIYGTKVTTSGSILDTIGIPISTTANSQYSPSIAFDGTNYLIIWTDYRNGSDSLDIYGARISPSGTVLDTAGVPISTAAYKQFTPSIAFDGTNYLVVWTDFRNGSDSVDIYGARVSPSGIVLDTTGVPISTAANNQYTPCVAFDGSNYLVVWMDFRGDPADIHGIRVSTSIAVLDTIDILISTAAHSQEYPSIAFDGVNYLVVWQDHRNGSDYDIYCTRVDTSGTVLDTTGIPLSTAPHSQEYPSIAFDGVNYLAVWQDHRNPFYVDIYGARVDTSGIVLDTAGIPISTAPHNQQYPSIAFDGVNYLILWQDKQSEFYSDIYGARVSPSGFVIDTFPVSNQKGNQISPAIARGSVSQMLAVYSGWTDSINGHPASTMRIWGKFSPFTGIEKDKNKNLNVQSELVDIFPNPFIQIIGIRYRVGTDCPQLTTIKVYDISGRPVKTLINGKCKPGFHTIKWDGTDNKGRQVSSGIYFLRFSSGKYHQAKKICLIK